MVFVYFLRCRGGTIYTGITSDLAHRLRQHRGEVPGGAKYTAAHPPLGYAAAWQVPDRGTALGLEYRLKRLCRSQKDDLISGKASLEYEKAVLSDEMTYKIGMESV